VPQGTFAIESALTQAAETIGIPVVELKKRNLLEDGDSLPYGVKLEKVNAGAAGDARPADRLGKRQAEVAE
jgi:xanthine dehydrogenase large subunit